MNRINYLSEIYGNKLSWLIFHPNNFFQEFKKAYFQICKAQSIFASIQKGERHIRIFSSADLGCPGFITDKESEIIFSTFDTARFLVKMINEGKHITHYLSGWSLHPSTDLGGREEWLKLLELLSGEIEGSSEYNGQKLSSLLLFYIRSDHASHASEHWEYCYVSGDEEESFYKIYCPNCEQTYPGVEIKTKMHKDVDYSHRSYDVEGKISDGVGRRGLDISCPKDHKICFAVESWGWPPDSVCY